MDDPMRMLGDQPKKGDLDAILKRGEEYLRKRALESQKKAHRNKKLSGALPHLAGKVPKEYLESKILIVDDDVSLADNCSGILRAYGFSHVEFCSQKLAGSYLSSDSYSLVLLDNDRGKGLENLKKMKNTDKTSLPVIYLTGYDSQSHLEEVFSLGANDLISKPFDMGNMLSKIVKCLKRFDPKNLRDGAPCPQCRSPLVQILDKRFYCEHCKYLGGTE